MRVELDVVESVGVVAHPGGLVVDRPDVTVGVVRAVSRLRGVEVELISRVPGDRVGPQGDRRPPVYDEGIDLRFGWVDEGRVRWAVPVLGETWHYQFPNDHFRAVFALPPLFGEVSWVVAWPQVGLGETVVVVALPERAAVERDDVPVWTAGIGTPVVGEFERRDAEPVLDPVDIETGVVVASPVVLHGAGEAVVVLSRVTAIGRWLALEVLSLAKGTTADVVAARPPGSSRPPPPRTKVAAVAVVVGSVAVTPHLVDMVSSDGSGRAEYVLPRPDGPLDLLVSWPLAGLSEVRVRVELAG